MDKQIRLAIDLDGVIVDKPPFVPRAILEFLFKGDLKEKLNYRFPISRWEQLLRQASHFYLFRPPIRDNLDFLKNNLGRGKFRLYVVSARYAFIKKQTSDWLSRQKIDHLFEEVFLNSKNQQPHLFKEEVLIKLKPDIFIDDDRLLVNYLAEKTPKLKIFYFSKGGLVGELHPRVKYLKSLWDLDRIYQ